MGRQPSNEAKQRWLDQNDEQKTIRKANLAVGRTSEAAKKKWETRYERTRQ